MKIVLKARKLCLIFFGSTRSLILLNILHIFNDGSKVALIILLPFLAREFHINLTQVGILGTILNTCLIIFAVPAGYISAKLGGVKVLLIALLFYAIGFITSGFSNSFVFLVITFFIAGMGYGMFHPIGLLLITKWSNKESRGREMGNFTALGDIGTVAIPAMLVSLVAIIGWRLATILFGLAFIAIFILFSFLMKPEPVQEEKNVYKHLSILSFFKHKQFLLAALTGALDNFASQPLIIFLPFLLLAKGMSPSLIGLFAAIYFIGSFIGKTYLGRSMDIFGNVRVFVISEFCMAFFIFVLTFSNFLPLIFIAAVIVGGFTKGTAPVAATMISDVVDATGNAEKIFGVNGLISGIAIALAPVLLGIISDKAGICSAFIVMAIIAILATIPAIGIRGLKVKELLG